MGSVSEGGCSGWCEWRCVCGMSGGGCSGRCEWGGGVLVQLRYTGVLETTGISWGGIWVRIGGWHDWRRVRLRKCGRSCMCVCWLYS